MYVISYVVCKHNTIKTLKRAKQAVTISIWKRSIPYLSVRSWRNIEWQKVGWETSICKIEVVKFRNKTFVVIRQ